MFLLGNAIAAVATLIATLAQIYVFILIGHIICSWVNADPMNPIVRFIWVVSEPLLVQIRRFIPPLGGLDFSVLIAILVVQIGIQGFLVGTLMDIARQLR
jgi:YggT family protein